MLSRSWTSWLALVVTATLGSAVLLGTVALGRARPDAIEAVVASAAPVDGEDLASEDGKSGTLRAALDKLVQAGVITAEQRDRILKAIEEEQAAAKRKRGQADKPKPPAAAQPKFHVLQHLVQDAAEAIGVSPGQLKQELRGGKSLKDVAQAHGVSRDALMQKLVAAETARIRKAHEAGRISKEMAERLERRLAEAVAKAVDAVRGKR